MSKLIYRTLPIATSLGLFEDLRGRVNDGELPACNLDLVATSELLGRSSLEVFFNEDGYFRHRGTPEIEDVSKRLGTILGEVRYHGPSHDSKTMNFGWHEDGVEPNRWALHLQGMVYEEVFRRTRFADTSQSPIQCSKRLSPLIVKDGIAYTGRTSLGWSTYFRESGHLSNGIFWYNSHYFTNDGLWTFFSGKIEDK